MKFLNLTLCVVVLLAFTCHTTASHDHSAHDHDHAVHDHAVHDHSAHDHAGHDHAVHDHAVHDHSAHDHAGHDHAVHDHAGHDHAGHDHTAHDHSAHDHAGHDHSHGHSHNHHQRKNPRVQGITALMSSILHSETDIALKYINDPTVNLSATNADGVSALMFCFGRRLYDLAELLIEKGANIHSENKDGVNALKLALTTVKDEDRRVKLVDMLVNAGADIVELSKTYPRAQAYLDSQKAKAAEAVEGTADKDEL